MKQRKAQGFNLIEVMIVVAIIGILASIVVPQYQDYIKTTGRSDATKALLKLADMQEHYVLRNNSGSYNPDMCVPSEFGYYTVCTLSADTKGYTLQAIAKAGYSQEGDKEKGQTCETLTLTHTGIKWPEKCWVQ